MGTAHTVYQLTAALDILDWKVSDWVSSWPAWAAIFPSPRPFFFQVKTTQIIDEGHGRHEYWTDGMEGGIPSDLSMIDRKKKSSYLTLALWNTVGDVARIQGQRIRLFQIKKNTTN